MNRSQNVLIIENPTDAQDHVSNALSNLNVKYDALDIKELLVTLPSDLEIEKELAKYTAIMVDMISILRDPTEASKLAINLNKILKSSQNIPTLLMDADPNSDLVKFGSNSWNDIILAPTSPTQILNRISSLLRFVTVKSELERRIETNTKFGNEDIHIIEKPQSVDDAFILVQGNGHNLPVINEALSSLSTLVGTFTSLSALDYLDKRHFDALILDARENTEDCAKFISDIRADSNHFELPIIALGPIEDIAWCDAVTKAGVTEVLDFNCNPNDLRRRAERLIFESRYRLSLREQYQLTQHSYTIDSLTGLFSHGFLLEHLNTMISYMAKKSSVFSLLWVEISGMSMVNRISGYSGGDRIIRQVGKLLSQLIRAEDLAAHSGGGRFALVLPDTTLASANSVVRRIQGIIRATEFSLQEIDHPVKIDTIIGGTEVMDTDTPDAIYNRVKRISRDK